MSPEQEPETLTIRWIPCRIWDDDGDRSSCCCDHEGCCRWVSDDGREFFESTYE